MHGQAQQQGSNSPALPALIAGQAAQPPAHVLVGVLLEEAIEGRHAKAESLAVVLGQDRAAAVPSLEAGRALLALIAAPCSHTQRDDPSLLQGLRQIREGGEYRSIVCDEGHPQLLCRCHEPGSLSRKKLEVKTTCVK